MAPPVSISTVLLEPDCDTRPTVKRSQVNQPPAYAAVTLPALPQHPEVGTSLGTSALCLISIIVEKSLKLGLH